MKSSLEKEMIEQFNLPNYVKGKSFADASKAIDNKFKDRNDNVSIDTKQELLGRLSKAQEYIKMQEALKANSQEVPDQMNGQIPEGFEQNQMFAGGRVPVQGVNELDANGIVQGQQAPLQADTSGLANEAAANGQGGSPIKGAGGAASGIAGTAGTALEFGNQMFGDTGIDTSGLAGRQEKTNVGMGAASGAAKGLAAGATFGPVGMAAGAVIGGAAGFIGGKKANKDIQEANMNASLVENNQHTNDFALGGKVPDPTDKDKLTKDVNKAAGVNFTSDAANRLFETVPGGVAQEGPSLDFGKYKDVGYFKMGNAEGDTLRVQNTKANPHNPSTIKPVMDELRQLNPGKNIELDYNSYATGGFMNDPRERARTVVDGAMFPLEQSGRVPLSGTPKVDSMPRFANTVGKPDGSAQGDYLASKANIGNKEYDYFNDPDNKMKGQGQVAGMRDYLASKANKGLKSGTTPANEQAAYLQGKEKKRSRLNSTEIGYEANGIIEGENLSVNDTLKPSSNNNVDVPGPQSRLSQVGDWLGENGAEIARYAPLVANAAQLASLKKPNTEKLDRLDSRYKTNYVDERSLENRIQNEASGIDRKLANASGGSASAVRAGLLGSQLNKTNALSDAYLKASDLNRQEDRAAQQFNAQNDRFNAVQSNREKDMRARDKAAYDGVKANMISGMAEDIGNIGKEIGDRKAIAKVLGYDIDGDYVVDKKGKRISKRELNQKLREYRKNNK